MRRLLIAALLAACAASAAAEQTIPAADVHVARMGRTVAEADGTVRFG
jgi:opacity protein-like surface antigen